MLRILVASGSSLLLLLHSASAQDALPASFIANPDNLWNHCKELSSNLLVSDSRATDRPLRDSLNSCLMQLGLMEDMLANSTSANRAIFAAQIADSGDQCPEGTYRNSEDSDPKCVPAHRWYSLDTRYGSREVVGGSAQGEDGIERFCPASALWLYDSTNSDECATISHADLRALAEPICNLAPKLCDEGVAEITIGIGIPPSPDSSFTYISYIVNQMNSLGHSFTFGN